MNLLCRIGIHIEKFMTCDVAGGSKCSCGKKSTPPIVWPRCEEAQMDRIEAIELLNTHFFSDVSKCREAWYLIRADNTPRDEIRLIAESIVSCINDGRYDNAKVLAESIIAELSPIG